jgi:hypothetical protein
MSGLFKVPHSLHSTIHEEVGKLKQAGQADQDCDACKKVLFDAEVENEVDVPSPVRFVWGLLPP